MVLLSALATAYPAVMGPKADPLVTPEVIKPEWYFYVTFRWLKLFTGTTAVLSMGFVAFIIFAWPFIDGAIRRKWPKSEASVWIGIGGVFLIVGLTVWETIVEH
jgi:ubiquinol-cytochrome c reductase cytochrome b subunit/cytochrome b6